MTTPALDLTEPIETSVVTNSIVAMQKNTRWLVLMAASTTICIPGWSIVVNGANKAKPDNIVLTNNNDSNIKMKLAYTWSGDYIQTIQYYWDDDGGGYVLLTNGTATLTYTTGYISGVTTA